MLFFKLFMILLMETIFLPHIQCHSFFFFLFFYKDELFNLGVPADLVARLKDWFISITNILFWNLLLSYIRPPVYLFSNIICFSWLFLFGLVVYFEVATFKYDILNLSVWLYVCMYLCLHVCSLVNNNQLCFQLCFVFINIKISAKISISLKIHSQIWKVNLQLN